MQIYIITASIHELDNLKPLQKENKTEIIIIDEGEPRTRRRNQEHLSNIPYRFYGPKERNRWFKKTFNQAHKKYQTVVPKRCHAETSFGFLIAYEENADIIIEIDDDVRIPEENNFINSHIENLQNKNGKTVSSEDKWYNTIENLNLNEESKVFPRGHPYDNKTRTENYEWTNKGEECILNMGLWTGHPDLDALAILYNGGLEGRCNINARGLKRDKIIVEKETYFPICSMNTSFKREIIPAFYQLYMKYLGIDRFDDIWSGIILKKIADHLGRGICLGKPIGFHEKRPRNVFRDLKAETEGMVINEYLWKIIDRADLNCRDYFHCYNELADHIEKNLEAFPEKGHRDFLKLQTDKMRLWLKIIDELERSRS